MPTYDYECTECGYSFEYFQAMSDAPLDKCPECGGRVRRLIGGGLGVIFKGSGFYVTDNKKSGSGTSGSVSKKSGTKADSSGGSETSGKTGGDSGSEKPAKKEKVTT